MKYCEKCGRELQDGQTCPNCYVQQDVESKNNVDTLPTKPKGIKGFFRCFKGKNFITLSMKQKIAWLSTLMGSILGLGVLLIVVTVTIPIAIENSAPYSYVTIKEFVQNWNHHAEQSPDGVTGGQKISNKDISDSYNYIHVGDTRISVNREGRDLGAIKYYNSHLGEEAFNASGKLKELLTICIPDWSSDKIESYVNDFQERVARLAPSDLDEFSIDFEKADNRESVNCSIKTPSLPSFIIRSNGENEYEFDCSLTSFFQNYNTAVKKQFGDTLGVWSISSDNLQKIAVGETFGNITISRFYLPLYRQYREVGALGFYVNESNGNIVQLTHTLGCSFADGINDTAQTNWKYKLPMVIYSSVGVNEEKITDYFQEAIKAGAERGYANYSDNLAAMNYIQTVNNTEMYYWGLIPCSNAYWQSYLQQIKEAK